MRYINSLPDTEIATLEEVLKNARNHKFRTRCNAILLSNKRFDVKILAKMFSVRTRTIYTWFDRYQEMGFVGLYFLSNSKKSNFRIRRSTSNSCC